MSGKINGLTQEQQEIFLDNTYNVSKITFQEDIQHNCPLGEQIGVIHYDVEVIPGKHLAELIQLHWDLQKMIGQSFTLESGADHVLQIVKEAYQDPEYVKVTSSCGFNRHMAVNTTVEYHK